MRIAESYFIGDLCGVAAILYFVLERGIVAVSGHLVDAGGCLLTMRVWSGSHTTSPGHVRNTAKYTHGP